MKSSGARALHHGCRVMESAFLLSRGRGEQVPCGQSQGGGLRAEGSVKKGQVGGAVAGSWRQWRQERSRLRVDNVRDGVLLVPLAVDVFL